MSDRCRLPPAVEIVFLLNTWCKRGAALTPAIFAKGRVNMLSQATRTGDRRILAQPTRPKTPWA
jgi:hypothetical protein